MSPELFILEKPTGQRQKVLRVELFSRRDSTVRHCLIQYGPWKKRLSTHTRIEQSAREFAELTFRHFQRQITRGRFDAMMTDVEITALVKLGKGGTLSKLDHRAIARIERKAPELIQDKALTAQGLQLIAQILGTDTPPRTVRNS